MKTTFLSIVCLLSIAGNSSVFAYSGGDGTKNSPYLISSKADMEELAAAVNGGNSYSGTYFLLTQDLSGANDTITTVIGNSATRYFSGIFDGGGHEIAANISVTVAEIAFQNVYAGIFGRISGATIKNLGVSGSISSSVPSHSGGICGDAANSTISNCYNTGNVVATSPSLDSFSGGICGIAGNSSISDCYNTGDITATFFNNPHSGGICGSTSNSSISDCYNTGDIAATASSSYYYCSYSGGICGEAWNSSISGCYNIGDIAAISYYSLSSSSSGGICGYATDSSISDCYNTGDIAATSSYISYSGGICGYGYGSTTTMSNCYNIGNIAAAGSGFGSSSSSSGGICGYHIYGGTIISNCFAANAGVTGSHAGRIWGSVSGGTITIENCHASASMLLNGETRSSQDTSSQNGKDEALTSFQSQSWIEANLEWDFNDIWAMSDINSFHRGLPILKALNNVGTAIPVIDVNRPDGVSVYPNPATNNLYITTEYPTKKVELYNSSGALLRLETDVTDQIDVSALTEGLYIARIYAGNQVIVRKVIIKK